MHVRTIAHPHPQFPSFLPAPHLQIFLSLELPLLSWAYLSGIIMRLPGAGEGMRPELGLGAAFV